MLGAAATGTRGDVGFFFGSSGSTPGIGKTTDDDIGGLRGCTHVREMMAPTTVAFQTIPNYRARTSVACATSRGALGSLVINGVSSFSVQ